MYCFYKLKGGKTIKVFFKKKEKARENKLAERGLEMSFRKNSLQV